MLDVEEQLRRYGEALEDEFLGRDTDVVLTDRRPRKARRRWLVAAAAVVVAMTAAAVTVRLHDERSRVTTQRPAGGGVFSSETGVVLLVSDGIDGATAIDLDAKIAGRRVISGERPGDQPFRLTLTGQDLVVGSREIDAAPLDGGASRKIDDATVYLAASEPGQVWTVTWQGGYIGQGVPTVREVSVNGDVVLTSTALDTATWLPVFGIPGGLVVQSSAGIAIWDAATGIVGPLVGAGQATSIASDGRTLVWCQDTCASTPSVALARTGPPTAPHIAAGRQQLALSSDGQRLAAVRPSPHGQFELMVKDMATGAESVVAQGLSPYGSIQWTDDGSQLFYAENSYRQTSTRLGRYSISNHSWEERTIPVGDAIGAMPINRDQARSFFNANLVQPQDCPGAGDSYPSVRTGVCSFSFEVH